MVSTRPDRTLPPGKTRYPFYRRLVGPQGRSGRAEILVPTGIRSRTVQPVAQSLYRLSYRAHTCIIHITLKQFLYTVSKERSLLQNKKSGFRKISSCCNMKRKPSVCHYSTKSLHNYSICCSFLHKATPA